MAKQETAQKTKTTSARAKPAKKMESGELYECEECGLVVNVVDPCGCEPEVCYITCCEHPMKKASARSKAGNKGQKAA